MSSIDRWELLDALVDLAATLGTTPTREEMNEHGRYSARPYYTEFGSWNDALREASLDTNHERVPPESITADIERVASELGHPPRLDDYDAHGDHHWATACRTFDSWPSALRAAGLDPEDRPYEKRTDRTALVEELRRIAMDLGRPPTADEMDEHGEYSRRPYVRAFGSWNDALAEAGVRPEE